MTEPDMRRLAESLTLEGLFALRDAVAMELLRRDLCTHGIRAGDWCPICAVEMHRARKEAGDE